MEARPTYDVITAEIRAQQPYTVGPHEGPSGYEPTFPRDGMTRRVMAFVTDQEDGAAVIGPGTAPRNTPSAIVTAMHADHPTLTLEQVNGELAKLGEAGFVAQRKDGTFYLTEPGLIELSN